MTLQIDARQRAMLREMGVELFWPAPEAASAVAEPAVAPAAAAVAEAPLARARMPEPVPQAVAPAARAPAAPAVARDRMPGIELMEWDALKQAVVDCRACKLCDGRRNTVFGVGVPHADWLIVGEAPGENEDLQGEPFVGQAGKLLDNMLLSLGLSRRESVYIANVLKCRPPGNRNPEPEEIAQCEPFLRRQVELLRPKIILAMGRFAVQSLLQSTEPVGKLRGRVHRYHDVPLVVTYHPAYLLRNLPDKAKAWSDLVLAKSVLQQQG